MLDRLIHWIRKKTGLPYEGDLRVINTSALLPDASSGTVFIVLRPSQRCINGTSSVAGAYMLPVSGWEVQMSGGGMVVWISDSMVCRLSKSVGGLG